MKKPSLSAMKIAIVSIVLMSSPVNSATQNQHSSHQDQHPSQSHASSSSPGSQKNSNGNSSHVNQNHERDNHGQSQGQGEHQQNQHQNGQQSHGRAFYFLQDVVDPSYPIEIDNDTFYNTANVSNNNGEGQPDGNWVSASNGEIPPNAIVFQNANPPNYYCRGMYNNQMYYGSLIPNGTCNFQDQSASIQLTDYEVLVAP